MPAKKTNLLVFAHPDDEALFFTGLILNEKSTDWHLICVTDGNGDGRAKERTKELQESARRLKVAGLDQWNYPDRFGQRLDTASLIGQLQKLRRYSTVYTHGPLGEYGHPHHQDVCYAVHKAFRGRSPVWSVAYNSHASFPVRLNSKQFEFKCRLLSEVYGLETRRFMHLLPATGTEGFVRLDWQEVHELYQALCEKRAARAKFLKAYKWLGPKLPDTAYLDLSRPF